MSPILIMIMGVCASDSPPGLFDRPLLLAAPRRSLSIVGVKPKPLSPKPLEMLNPTHRNGKLLDDTTSLGLNSQNPVEVDFCRRQHASMESFSAIPARTKRIMV